MKSKKKGGGNVYELDSRDFEETKGNSNKANVTVLSQELSPNNDKSDQGVGALNLSRDDNDENDTRRHLLMSPDSPNSSDFYYMHDDGGGRPRFVTPKVPAKTTDMCILILANPRAGSQLARVYVTDFPKETSKLVMQGNQMISTKLLIFDVTDKADKDVYTQLIESQAPHGKL